MGVMSGIKGMAASLFGGNVVVRFLELLKEPAEHFLAKNINNMLKNNGEEIVSNMIGSEVDNILNKPVCKLLEGHDEQLEQAVNTVESIYSTIINEHLPKILDSIDISKIVDGEPECLEFDEDHLLMAYGKTIYGLYF